LAKTSILIADVEDATDEKPDLVKSGPVYVPFEQTVEMVYSSAVARSFETGNIRKFIEVGHLTADFVFHTLPQQAAVGYYLVTTGTYTAETWDRYLPVCTAGSPVTIQLPPLATHATRMVRIVDARGNASANPITVLPAPGETINGGPSALINTDYGVLDLQGDCGTDWFPISTGGGGTNNHSLLLGASLVWGASAHTGPPNTIAGFDGAGGATTYALPGGGRTDFGVSPADPVGAPSAGDKYYNSALQMEMRYDSLRSKWLSVESTEFFFGRNGPTNVGQYYRTVDGRVMTATLGMFAVRSGTVVSFGYTRATAAAATFEITSNGAQIATVASAAASGRDIAINADFSFGNILGARNLSPGSVTREVVGWIRVKWRV
jgi:hypothetical protein